MRKWWKYGIYALVGIVVLLMVLPFTLYIPAVQRAVKNFATSYASEATGYEISIDQILLQFPLDLKVDGVCMLDEQRDTMLSAQSLLVDVSLLPLINLDVQINKALLTSATYHLVTADSSLILHARVKHAEVLPAEIRLASNIVNLSQAQISGAKIALQYFPEKAVKEDKEPSKGWTIRAQKLTVDSIEYTMNMRPTIDSLHVALPHAELDNGFVNTDSTAITVSRLFVQDADVLYNSKPGAPSPGLDASHILVKRASCQIENYEQLGSAITVPVTMLKACERSGVEITQGRCRFATTGKEMRVDSLLVKTMLSEIRGDAALTMSLLDSIPKGSANLLASAKIGLGDISMLYPSLKPILDQIPQSRPIEIHANIGGNERLMKVKTLTAALPQYASAKAEGDIENALDTKKLAADINFDGEFLNLDFAKPMALNKEMQKQVNLPPLNINGNVTMRGDETTASLTATTGGGRLACDAGYKSKGDIYSLSADINRLPIHAFLPLSKIGNLTASLAAHGKGFNYDLPSFATMAHCQIDSIAYGGTLYRSLSADVTAEAGNVTAHLASQNPNMHLSLDATGAIAERRYKVDMHSDIQDLNLYALHVLKTPSKGRGKVNLKGDIDLRTKEYKGNLQLADFHWTHDTMRFFIPEMDADVLCNDSLVSADIINEDFKFNFNSYCSLDTLLARVNKATNIYSEQLRKNWFEIKEIRAALPQCDCHMTLGTNNVVQRFLRDNDLNISEAKLNMKTDSTVHVDGFAHGIKFKNNRIDTITIKASERWRFLTYSIHMGNKKGTWDDFAQVTLRGGFGGNRVMAHVNQQNIKKQTGFNIGFNASYTDSVYTADFFPKKPVIGYRNWSVNYPNHLTYDLHSDHIDADLKLMSDTSFVQLASVKSDIGEDLLELKVGGVQIAEWIKLSPFAPPLSGVLEADINVNYERKNFWGDGTVQLKDFHYNKQRVGDFALNANMEHDPVAGKSEVYTNMVVNGSKVLYASCALADSAATTPIGLDVELEEFPLYIIDPFIPNEMAMLEGYLSGNMKMSGDANHPMLNGQLSARQGAVNVPMMGAKINLPQTPITLVDNVVNLKNYALRCSNSNPITIDGQVNINNLSDIAVDLAINGNNVQFVNAKQYRQSQVFGKGFLSLNATARGTLNRLHVNANASLLSGSNITYVLSQNVGSTTDRVDENMVKFVNLTDTTSYEGDALDESSRTSAMTINANISIQSGTTVNVYLTRDGRDRVVAQANGSLNFYQGFTGDPRLIGRINIENGSVRYKPPLISQKDFTFLDGSYVNFTGEILNPGLHISGYTTQKASITTASGGSNLVNFNVAAYITGTLNEMGIKFDMSTDEDMTVQNELQSMSESQRSNTAINMLLYGAYTGMSNSSAQSNLGNTVLYSFLSSQLNKWAASAVKGVDLSFGIDQFNNASGAATTSYSYKMSKSLFDDRFKIVVGGNYNTDTAADKISDQLFSDISFEYLLNKSGSMYVRLFRHTGFESVLEGEITEMGVGFVLKRKLSNLKRLFRFGKRKKSESSQ